MFKFMIKTAVFLSFVLLFSGCGGDYSGDTGFDLSELVYLDSELQAEIILEKGEVFGLDMPDPVVKGHAIIGASFDPTLFRMERYIEYEDDGKPRIRYLFIALACGGSDVVIRMRVAGGMEGIYRTARVVVGGE